MKRLFVILLVAAALGPAGPAAAQIGAGGVPRYPYQSNPIDQAVRDAQRPLPRLPAAPPPAVRYVPEQRFVDPGTRNVIVVPGHEERRLSDTQVTVPPLTGYGPGGPVAIPGGDRPPADVRPTP